jgi:hypothetical protein
MLAGSRFAACGAQSKRKPHEVALSTGNARGRGRSSQHLPYA